MTRVITALVLVPATIFLIFQAHPWAFFTAVAVVAALCYREYADLVSRHGLQVFGPVGYAAGVGLLVTPQPFPVIVLFALLGMVFALRERDLVRSLAAGGAFLLGLAYIWGAWRTGLELRGISPHWFLFALAVNWFGDSAAMYVGKTFGRHKLAPGISPGKTIEGSLGSLAASLIFGFAYLKWALPTTSLPLIAAASVAGNVAGQAGDLAESAIKRGAGVKDSGSLLPGHGGALDRLDSSLFTIPVVWVIVNWWGAR